MTKLMTYFKVTGPSEPLDIRTVARPEPYSFSDLKVHCFGSSTFNGISSGEPYSSTSLVIQSLSCGQNLMATFKRHFEET